MMFFKNMKIGTKLVIFLTITELLIGFIAYYGIIVVLIGLVIIFQTNIKGVVASIFSTIQKNAGSVR